MKNLLIAFTTAIAFTGCSTMYTDSARTADGGMYITGSYDNQKVIYYCPKSLNKTDCKKVQIINK